MKQRRLRDATAVVAGGFLGESRGWMYEQSIGDLKAMVEGIGYTVYSIDMTSKKSLLKALIYYKKTVGIAAKKVAQGKLIDQ